MKNGTLSEKIVKQNTTKTTKRGTSRRKKEKTITLLLSEARQIQRLCDHCGMSPSCFAVLEEVFTLLNNDQLALQEDSMFAHCIDFLAQKMAKAAHSSSDKNTLCRYTQMLDAVNRLHRNSRMISNGFIHLSNIDQAAVKLGTIIREKCEAVDGSR